MFLYHDTSRSFSLEEASVSALPFPAFPAWNHELQFQAAPVGSNV